MRSINKVILIGNLTRDPEMRETPNGQKVTTFGIATNREWVTKEGERKNSAEFHECVAWAKLAEICANYIKKGSLVYVEGYLKTRNWETPEGEKKFKTEIVMQDLIILEKKNHNGGNGGAITGDDAATKDDSATTAGTTGDDSTQDPATDQTQETQAAQPQTETPAAEPATETPAPAEQPKEEENKGIDIDADLGL